MILRYAVLFVLAVNYVPRTVEDPSGSYSGVKQVGADPYSYEFIDLTLVKGSTDAKVIWVWRDQAGERERRELTLSQLKLDAAGLSGVVKGKRPKSIPEKWKGKFVTKTPPANAKGPVMPGLLLDGGWFVTTEEVPLE